MTLWKSFGASVIGPSHVASGKPNQDSWRAFHHVWGDGIVVSDGLGSKPFSDCGSNAACLAVVSAIQSCVGESEISNAFLSEQIKTRWLSLITPLKFRDCAATCLFAFRMNDGFLRVGMLGDGLAAAVKTDGFVESLSDDKTEGFSNTTDALSPSMTEKSWRWLSLPENDCQSIVLCTDGVADDLEDADGFIKEFSNAHRHHSSVSAARCAREMLENWPTPRHSDDKTIACLLRVEGEYE
jgi:serine/threonine protein phosphatase PrpC